METKNAIGGKNDIRRRDFFKAAGAGVAAAAHILTPRDLQAIQEAAHNSALDRIASNSYPIRPLFKSRANPNVPPRPAGDNAGNPAATANPDGRGGRGGGGANAEAAAALAENPNAKGPLAVAQAAAAARAASNMTTAEMEEKNGAITMHQF